MPETTNKVIITDDLGSPLHDVLNNQYSSVAVIVDENTGHHCLPLLSPLLPEHFIIQTTSGEEHKNLTTCQFIWEELTRHNVDRKALVINLGGGVIGDMGGFCAATYKRGIHFIQIPTTLLAQVDASVGGKLGIDFQGYKNHIGVFQTPERVIIHDRFLKTLNPRELRSGFAEIIKHALIADKDKWKEISALPFEQQNWKNLAAHSVEIKKRITQSDPTEKGLRKILNFGHTIGHAVESFFLKTPERKLLHGEAIAIGMIAEAFLSYQKGFISKADCDDIKAYILSVYPSSTITDEEVEAIVPLTLHDKKNEKNAVRAALLQHVGEANYDIEISGDDVRAGLDFYLN